MTILSENFGMAELKSATNLNEQTIKAYLQKGYPVTSEHIIGGGGGRGHRRSFSFYSVMEFSIAAALSDLSRGTRDMAATFRAAQNFAHFGGGGVAGLPDRLPALPFHHSHGETIFGVAGERCWELPWRPGVDVYIRMREHLACDHFVLLNASTLFEEVCKRLGVCPLEVLDEAYPETANND